MTPFSPPCRAPVLGRPFYLGAVPTRQAQAPSGDDTAHDTLTGIGIFRTAAHDLAVIWNNTVGLAVPALQIPMPAVGETTSALGVGTSAYSIATQGPNVQNVSGLGLGLGHLWEGTKNLVGLGDGPSIIAPALSFLGLGLSSYQLAEHPSPSAAASVATTGVYTAGYAASAVGLESAAAALSVAAPAVAVVSLPFIIGSIMSPILRAAGITHAAAHFPSGFVEIQGSDLGGSDGSAAVDPATGRILVWSGKHYYWSDQTQQGIPMTPQQFQDAGIQPTGNLAKLPGYKDVHHFRDDALQMAQTYGAQAGVPQDVIRSYQEEQRQPAIDEIKQEHPDLSPGQQWQVYESDPRYEAQRQADAALEAAVYAPQERGNQ